ncbi:probable chitinase 2 [Caerostris extrusa]|uniref:Probable chitinase 2 n=1 Tax=Caerostris extrusa TaxID=172846 RepID=A0AAV4V5C2_CAEEX|nr:probable chitinase 2 [Caerostris extrusa]
MYFKKNIFKVFKSSNLCFRNSPPPAVIDSFERTIRDKKNKKQLRQEDDEETFYNLRSIAIFSNVLTYLKSQRPSAFMCLGQDFFFRVNSYFAVMVTESIKMSANLITTILILVTLTIIEATPVKSPSAQLYAAGKASSHKYKVVCYYGSWAVYRPGDGFDNRIRCLDPYYDLEENYGKGAFKRFTGLKKINPELKTIVAIGGWNEGSTRYSNMAASSSSRKIFVDSVVEFVRKHNFDGLDMDWEYPATRGGKPEDKQNFVALLRELKAEFQKYNLLLTAAVSAGKHTIDEAYDIPQVSQTCMLIFAISVLNRYLDFVNVMCYDYHGGWESFTGHNAPLYARPDDNKENQMLNLNYSINYWISKGAPREKSLSWVWVCTEDLSLFKEQKLMDLMPLHPKRQSRALHKRTWISRLQRNLRIAKVSKVEYRMGRLLYGPICIPRQTMGRI